MSPASIKAGNIIRQWMEDAGLRTWGIISVFHCVYVYSFSMFWLINMFVQLGGPYG